MVGPHVRMLQPVHTPVIPALRPMPAMRMLHMPVPMHPMPMHPIRPVMMHAVDARIDVDPGCAVDDPAGDRSGVHTDIDKHRLGGGRGRETQCGDSSESEHE